MYIYYILQIYTIYIYIVCIYIYYILLYICTNGNLVRDKGSLDYQR